MLLMLLLLRSSLMLRGGAELVEYVVAEPGVHQTNLEQFFSSEPIFRRFTFLTLDSEYAVFRFPRQRLNLQCNIYARQ